MAHGDFPLRCQQVVPKVKISQIGIRLQCQRNRESVVIGETVPFKIEIFQWRVSREEIGDPSVAIRFDTVKTESDVSECIRPYPTEEVFDR